MTQPVDATYSDANPPAPDTYQDPSAGDRVNSNTEQHQNPTNPGGPPGLLAQALAGWGWFLGGFGTVVVLYMFRSAFRKED